MNNLIPKNVHLSWVRKDILNYQSEFIKIGLKNLVELNPNWNVTIYDNEEIEEYLKSNLDLSDYNLIKETRIVEKLDLWRLIKLYNEGGLYCDLDRPHNIPLDNILDENTKCVLPTCVDLDFAHTFMMSAPGNPIYATTANLVLTRRHAGSKNVYFLGPQTYMHGVTQILIGQMINSDPGAEVFDQIRNTINQIPFLKTYRETSVGDLITNKSDLTFDQYEIIKRKFYADFGVPHWTGEW